MKPAPILAIGLLIAIPAAVRAQPCLSLSDGSGTTTVSCPDGRSGLLHTDPAGGVSGMIGTQPFAGTAAGIDPVGAPAGVPSPSYLTAPPPPSIAAPPPEPPVAAAIATPAPATDLTALQQDYLAEQAALRARRAAAARAATSAPAGR